MPNPETDRDAIGRDNFPDSGRPGQGPAAADAGTGVRPAEPESFRSRLDELRSLLKVTRQSRVDATTQLENGDGKAGSVNSLITSELKILEQIEQAEREAGLYRSIDQIREAMSAYNSFVQELLTERLGDEIASDICLSLGDFVLRKLHE